MKMLITAGPTREPIDAVRFVSNRSSGRLGIALAQQAIAQGHPTTLLLAAAVGDEEVRSLVDTGLTIERFDSVAELTQQLDAHWSHHDVLIMAAAVADYTPQSVAEGKLRRVDQELTIRFKPTPDLVAMMAAQKRPGQVVIAFALEEKSNLEQRAQQKLHRKGVDAIVANPLDTVGENTIWPLWLTAGGQREELRRMTKTAFSRWLLREIDQMRSTKQDQH